jgi:hypothetical protein
MEDYRACKNDFVVNINIIIMLNKCAAESKRKDLELPSAIFGRAFKRI